MNWSLSRSNSTTSVTSRATATAPAIAPAVGEHALDHVVEHGVELGGAARGDREQLLAISAIAADALRRCLEPIDHLVHALGELAELVPVEDGDPAHAIGVLALDDLRHDRADAPERSGDRPGEEAGADRRP